MIQLIACCFNITAKSRFACVKVIYTLCSQRREGAKRRRHLSTPGVRGYTDTDASSAVLCTDTKAYEKSVSALVTLSKQHVYVVKLLRANASL